MRLVHVLAAMLACGVAVSLSAGAQQVSSEPAFDASTPLESRIGGELPATTIRSYTDTGRVAPTLYTPTDAEKREVAAALNHLAPLQRSIAEKRLRSITFANGLLSNAQATRSSFGDADSTFDIVFNPILLNETVSDFLTRKERQLFDTSGSTLSVHVDGGSMDAIAYVLLHEVTHMVDMSLKLTPQGWHRDGIPDEAHTAFTRGVWASTFGLATPYHDSIFERVNFAPDAKTIPVAEAKSLYEALGKTPAVSIYATRGYPEDIAESVAWRQMQKLNQPYRVEIRDGARVVYSFEPMKNPLVQKRLAQLDRFDSPVVN
jgi:hypothetical protein